MSGPLKMTLHDHAMVHALHVLAQCPWDAGEGETHMIWSILRDVTPGVTRSNALLAPLALQADRVIRNRGPILSLQHELRAPCHQFNRLRLAAAWANINGEG